MSVKGPHFIVYCKVGVFLDFWGFVLYSFEKWPDRKYKQAFAELH